ncbi:SsrA-binding protein SmpB [Rickettsia endosymbiont of Cardiosporidium cionae]|uniref:SsrA-binding protein SmpB n=1 Tax=Rickettsia endosymbiont of Cardiosporidium cionae TaxID=2777155 RepID=UPI001894F1D7|nr:SsrA-binding protein SmpB [Rickettsia endosymbiont of Cardiosporidium cionae]KAF8818997.1 SsrA-binding protein SmpB [Rickettsia endosymbiont of Cardiosporidium cionae]
MKTISYNRKIKFEYFIKSTTEAGIVLTGSEVKSVRKSMINISDAYAVIENNEVWLYNFYIAEYKESSELNHSSMRIKKLLLKKLEIKKLLGKLKIKGYSLAVVSVYFNSKNLIKLTLALVIGKKQYDKRASIKEREWKRKKNKEIKLKAI